MSKYKIVITLTVLALLFGLAGAAYGAPTGDPKCSFKMPANPGKILAALIERGEISPDATLEQKEAAVQAYLQQKTGGCDPDQGNIPARKKVNAQETALNLYTGEIRGRKLGTYPEKLDPSSPTFKELESTDKVLVILVDFADEDYTWQPVEGDERTAAGPLYNQIPVPDNDFDLWVEDFSTQHFEDMLFTPGGWAFSDTHPYYPGEPRGSMLDYFLEQSYGKYIVKGKAYGWFTVDKPEAYYGDDSPDGGIDNLRPGTTKDLLSDVVDVINAEGAIEWKDYDQNDPYDLNGNGRTDEPDCILDHPMFVHAGIDQSGGGGAQGDDAIWAHSSSTVKMVSEEKNSGATCPDFLPGDGTWLYNYTIMPEDGGVGVFAHEYAHDLGLPDEYDTNYSGYGASTAFWTLQSSGSWIGQPAQTQPSGMSIWAKYALGWADPSDNLAVIELSDLSKDPLVLQLEQTEFWGGDNTINGVKINLPDKYFYVNTPASGEWEWFGGKADAIDHTLRRTVDLTGATSAELSFWTWYDIEPLWDFGFVQVSTDGGATWSSLPIEGTTSDHDPDAMETIVAQLPGFTGDTGGDFLEKTFDLSEYAGGTIELQFRYMTDNYTTHAGFYLDDIRVVADGVDKFFDDVEVEDPDWIADGWTREQGSGYAQNYYIMEWRNLSPMDIEYDENTTLVNFDVGLNNAYTYDPFGETPNQPYYFPYGPGLLLFYRDFSYTDNWTGAHPGGGFLLVVDAHKRPLIRPPYKANYAGLEWDTRVQSYDAAFGLDFAPDITLTRYGVTRTYQGQNGVPNFNDYLSYWSAKAPSASVQTPENGLLFRILDQAENKSRIAIGFGNRQNLEEELYLTAAADYFMIFEDVFLPLLSK